MFSPITSLVMLHIFIVLMSQIYYETEQKSATKLQCCRRAYKITRILELSWGTLRTFTHSDYFQQHNYCISKKLTEQLYILNILFYSYTVFSKCICLIFFVDTHGITYMETRNNKKSIDTHSKNH